MEIVRDAARTLRLAQRAWADLGVAHRVGVLNQWAAEIQRSRAGIIAALSEDTGRVGLSEMEADSIIGNITRCSDWARELYSAAPVPDVEGSGITLHRIPEPLGVVGVISPWNFPLQLALIDAVPALLAGCAVLLKPSELTPRFVEPLRASIEAVPELARVLRIVTGGPETGRAVVDEVQAVCFTGSVATGREVARHAADRFIPAFLELGGKDAAIVCASADLELATSALLWGSTANAGQSCMSIERVYVAEEVEKRFTEILLAKARYVTLDLTGDGTGQVSRFIDRRQAAVVTEHLSDAVAKGAVVRCGGQVQTSADGSLFMPPTVVTGVDHSMRIMTEETFGPVIPVMGYATPDAAIAYANSTSFGLSAAVFGAEDEALDIARRLEAGGISVNDVLLTGLVPVGEKQAFKFSGLGPSRMGPAAVARFVRRRIALVRQAPKMQPWWYDDPACCDDALRHPARKSGSSWCLFLRTSASASTQLPAKRAEVLQMLGLDWPTAAMVGLMPGVFISGTVLVENVFNLLGTGQQIVSSFKERDYPVSFACTPVTATIFLVSNVVVDLLHFAIDPRIRQFHSAGGDKPRTRPPVADRC